MEETRGGAGRFQQMFARLSPRERKLGVVWIVAMLIIGAFVLSTTVLSSLSEMETKIEENQEALEIIGKKQAVYLSKKGAGGDSLDDRLAKNDLRLTTFMDKQASRFDIKISNFKDGESLVGGKKPKKGAPVGVVEEWVAVDIDGVEYDKAVRFLDSLQSSKELIVIRKVQLTRPRRGKNQDKVDVKLTVSTFKKKKEES